MSGDDAKDALFRLVNRCNDLDTMGDPDRLVFRTSDVYRIIDGAEE
jgi:hypothetical protein